MEKLRETFEQVLNERLIQMVLSNTRDAGRAAKIKVRPVFIKDELKFQETIYRGTQVFHGNFSVEEMRERLAEYMENLFRQAEISCETEGVTILVSKKGTVTVKRKKKQVCKN